MRNAQIRQKQNVTPEHYFSAGKAPDLQQLFAPLAWPHQILSA
jgi:hypothetical protein